MLGIRHGVTMPIDPILLTIPQTAEALAVSRATVYRLLDEGTLDCVFIRNKRRVRPADITRYLDAQQRRQHESMVKF